MTLAEQLFKAVNKLAKWRMVFTGWQLGTRTMEDPEAQAVRDHRETTLLMRAEVNAFTGLLLEKGVFTQEELQKQMIIEAEHLDRALEAKFPGYKSTDIGMTIDPQRAAETMKGWRK